MLQVSFIAFMASGAFLPMPYFDLSYQLMALSAVLASVSLKGVVVERPESHALLGGARVPATGARNRAVVSRLMDKSVLMIAFHFPPAAMSSGHLRTLGFARHLPTSGWKPIVLSARALAYPRSMPVADGLIPKDCQVERAFALDVSRHLAIAGKYPGFLAQPDRWASWWPAAVASGLRLIRRHHVKAIWSTYPIMTAHCVAHTLSRLTRLPWIADFRDPVSTSVEPGNPYSFASQHRWERRVLSKTRHGSC
ncbi:hypothetical protein RLIN73S_06233 [Rhodanobacter lindaniclasticus]